MTEQTELLDEEKPEIVTKDVLKDSLQTDWGKKTQVQKAHAVLNYLNTKTDQKFTTVSPAGKPTGHTNLIISLVKNGYDRDHFKTVIDNQCYQWSSDDKMVKYLRPSTLFAKKNFENYLDVTVQKSRGGPIQEEGKAPDLLEELRLFLVGFRERNHDVWGYEMPPEPLAAAKWWRDEMQEDMLHHEGARKIQKKNAKHSGDNTWEFPYMDRLLYTLRLYLLLDGVNQKIVYGCAQEKVFWRGDSIDDFYSNEHSIYNETQTMREIGID